MHLLKSLGRAALTRGLASVRRREMGSARFFNSGAAASPKPDEFEMQIPGMTVAAKSWGSGPTPVLCIHGWMDNANSFDRLLPMLPLDKFQFVVPDLPGHGLTSHYPVGANYSFMDTMLYLNAVMDRLGWPRSHVLAHSMGAGIGSLFTALFPERVERFLSLDLLSFGPRPVDMHTKLAKKSLQKSMKVNERQARHEAPTEYDFEEAVALIYMGNQMFHGSSSISQQSVELIMQRGLKKLPSGKFAWRADSRLRVSPPFHITLEQALHYARGINCPHLVAKSEHSPFYMSDEDRQVILKTLKDHNPDFEYHTVDGGHHVHVDHPERVAPIVGDFLLKQFPSRDSKD